MGNPTVDEITAFQAGYTENFRTFVQRNGLPDRPIIALLAGSRKQEIKDNLPDMIRAVSAFPDYQLVLAGAPGISYDYYRQYVGNSSVKILFGETYPLLSHAKAALVTSGTATLETALFKVPQVVCYHTPIGKVIAFLKRHLLSVKYISLVNLIANREVVRELVADLMTVDEMKRELGLLLQDVDYCNRMQQGYGEVAVRLGEVGAPCKAARLMYALLHQK
ncbi:lipid-A-disaccharide synthase [gut metagenome]|uniref:lipid-A-disaccharide synthase n=1 Tax=gut metagenome TaxID=749906 RepID=J9GS69_9ZZZZ